MVSMKVTSTFLFFVVVLILGAIYLWATLPVDGDQFRLIIVAISIVLIFILGNTLKHESSSQGNEFPIKNFSDKSCDIFTSVVTQVY